MKKPKKVCSNCKQLLFLSRISPAKYGKFGKSAWCRKCHCIRAKKSREKDLDKFRNRFYLRKYGMTLLEYNNLHEDQQGLCAICVRPESAVVKGVVKRLAVDHCHQTRRIRGLLCQNCNRALGLLQESFVNLTAAGSYLLNAQIC